MKGKGMGIRRSLSGETRMQRPKTQMTMKHAKGASTVTPQNMTPVKGR